MDNEQDELAFPTYEEICQRIKEIKDSGAKSQEDLDLLARGIQSISSPVRERF